MKLHAAAQMHRVAGSCGERLPDETPSPADLLVRVAAARRIADDAERAIVVLAVEWAHAHPAKEETGRCWQVAPTRSSWLEQADPELSEQAADAVAENDPEGFEWTGIPPVAWDAPAAFAAANAMSTTSGKALMRDALVLAHRLPRIWARLVAGEVPAWRARIVAQQVIAAPADVVAAVDIRFAPLVHAAGSTKLVSVIDEEMLRLHAEQREAEQLEALDARYVRLDEATMNHIGVAELVARGDWKDLHDLDLTLSEVAAALADLDPDDPYYATGESLDVRRSRALGLLADPAAALQILGRDQAAATIARAGRRRDRSVLYVHLTGGPVDAPQPGLDPVAAVEGLGPVLDQAVREWLGRPGAAIRVQPVIDLNRPVDRSCDPTDHARGYDIPDSLAEAVRLAAPECVFPWCHRPARACDLDHCVAYRHERDPDGSSPDPSGGPTCRCNLLPLCRHHHNLKTHGGWTYQRADDWESDHAWGDSGVVCWRDPQGRTYLRAPTGTLPLTG